MFTGLHLTAKCSKYAEYITILEDWPFSEVFLILHTLAPSFRKRSEVLHRTWTVAQHLISSRSTD